MNEDWSELENLTVEDLVTRRPAFSWGQRVVAVVDLENDGSLDDPEEDRLLVPRGTKGEVVRTGIEIQTRQNVYLVEFESGLVIGCLERELSPL